MTSLSNSLVSLIVLMIMISCDDRVSCQQTSSPVDKGVLRDPRVIQAFDRLQKVRFLRQNRFQEQESIGDQDDDNNEIFDQEQVQHHLMKRSSLHEKEVSDDDMNESQFLSSFKESKKKNRKQKQENQEPSEQQPKLLVLMIDAFRFDYFKQPEMSVGLRHFLSSGSRSPFVTPIFPSKTYPNMFSQVTGMFAESHGIVDNNIYDRRHNQLFFSSKSGPEEQQGIKIDVNGSNSFWWNQSTPIWTTAEKRGLKTGIFYWEGCQTEIQGINVTFCQPYESLVYLNWTEYQAVYEEVIREAMRGFLHEDWSLSMIYFEAVDHNGHSYGLNSPEFKKALSVTDELIFRILTYRKVLGLESSLNIILLSDHGMTFPPSLKDLNNWVNISDYLSAAEDSRPMIGSGTIVQLFPKDHQTFVEMYVNLTRAEIQGGCKVYAKGLDLPSRFHIENERTADIVVVADLGFNINFFSNPWMEAGLHGFDPDSSPDMRGFFAGNGPAFKSKGFVSSQGMTMTDHYLIFCHVLGIDDYCHESNGSWTRVRDLFRREDVFMKHKTSSSLEALQRSYNRFKEDVMLSHDFDQSDDDTLDSYSAIGHTTGVLMIFLTVFFAAITLLSRR